MENCKEIMEQHLERADIAVRLLRRFWEESEIEKGMLVRMLGDIRTSLPEAILAACMQGIVGRFPVNRAMLPFIAGAFGAARELVLTACVGEMSEEDLAELSEVADEVTKMLVENSTVVAAKVKVEDDKTE